MNQNEKRRYLIRYLLDENERYSDIDIPDGADDQRALLRGLMNIRYPAPVSEKFLEIQDEYFTCETHRRGVTDAADITPVRGGLCIWQGDITTLRCDAIVNAANSGMTGCYIPGHRCIDNCIHTYAGIRLRLECAQIMEEQGYEEPAGRAKITKAYSLPCRYILHTVGPIVTSGPTPAHRQLLADCYWSCLDLAAENALESVAFCCISTGEFHFPNAEAARIAVETVTGFMEKETSIKKVIFNVFKDTDRKIYEDLLSSG